MARSRRHEDEDPIAENEDVMTREFRVRDANGDVTVIKSEEWDDARQVPLYSFKSDALLSLSDIEAMVYLAREKFGTLRGLSAPTHYGAIVDAAERIRDENEAWSDEETEEDDKDGDNRA